MNINSLFNKKRFFGLDIGSSSVKLVELAKSGEKIRIVNAKLIDLNVDPTSLQSEKKDFLIKQVIERLINETGVKSGRLSLAISGQSVFIRFVKFPKVAKGKVEQMIKYEAQLQVPFPINEVIWDYHIFEEPQNPDMEVTLVAVKRDIIENLLSNFTNVKFDIEFIDVIPFVIYNLVNFADNYEGKIILEIGAKLTNIIIVDKNKVWTRSILIAGDEITKAIANALQIDFTEAESLKKKEGIVIIEESDKSFSSKSEEISSAVTPVLIDILADVSKTIGYYKSQFGETKVFNEILITGGSSKLKNIEKFFKNNLELNVRHLGILEKLKPNVLCNIDETQDERFGIALGLALRQLTKAFLNINLLPKEIINSTILYRKRWFIFSLLSAIIFISLTINFLLLNVINYKKEIIIDAQNFTTLHSNYSNHISKLNADIDKLNAKLNIEKEISQERTYWLRLLLEIERLMPRTIWLVHLEQSGNSLILEGNTFSPFSVITDFKNSLKKSDYFTDVTIASANLETKKPIEGKDLKIFSLKLELKKD